MPRALPRDDPDWSEDHENSLTGFGVVCISEKLGQLEQGVPDIMDNEDEGAHPDKVGGPGEHDQANGGLVVDEHLPEVFPLDIKELADGEGPVECHLQHVVQPDISGNLFINRDDVPA